MEVEENKTKQEKAYEQAIAIIKSEGFEIEELMLFSPLMSPKEHSIDRQVIEKEDLKCPLLMKTMIII